MSNKMTPVELLQARLNYLKEEFENTQKREERYMEEIRCYQQRRPEWEEEIVELEKAIKLLS